MGADGIREIADLLSGEPPEIQNLMGWPCHIAALDREIISPQDALLDPMLTQ